MGKNSSDGSNKTWIWVICAIVVIVIVVIFLIKGCGTKEYSVKFNTAGGTAVNSITVEADGTITKPSNPTRDGYEFAGWYLNDKLFDFNTKITSDMTLEAKWNKIGEESKITLGSTKLTLTVGGTEKLSVSASGNASTNGLVWKSSDESVVTVDSNGNLKALKAGKATITVTTADGTYSAECTVTVAEKNGENVPVTKVEVTGLKEVEAGKTITLKATVTPNNATNKKVTWTSSDKKIATVSSKGVVTGVSAGTVTITVKSADGNAEATYTVTVTPKKDEPVVSETVNPEGITLNRTSANVKPGDVVELTAKVTPDNATNKKVVWKSSDETVATVDANGKVTTKGEGTAKITATVEGTGISASCEIKVEYVYTIYFSATQRDAFTPVLNLEYTVSNGVKDNIEYDYFIVGNQHWTSKDVSVPKALVDGLTSIKLYVNGKEVNASVKITIKEK